MKTIEESIASISTEDLIEVMSEQWKGIESILEEIDNFMTGVKTNHFYLTHSGINLNRFMSEEHEEKEILSQLQLMDLAYARNVTIAGLLATSYEQWIKEKEEEMRSSNDWDDEFDLNYIAVDLLWREHKKWVSVIGQVNKFKS